MKLTPVTDDVFQLALPPRRFINAYLLSDVLVDAGLPLHAGRIVKALAGHEVVTHVITHAHGDHVGGSKSVSDALGVPAWCGAGDAEAVRAGKPVAASRVQSLFRWKPIDVARGLREGDEVGPGFRVLDTPGHSPGHIALWRERDRTLICGDVFLNLNFYTTIAGLNEPPRLFTVDPARNGGLGTAPAPYACQPTSSGIRRGCLRLPAHQPRIDHHQSLRGRQDYRGLGCD